MSREETGLRRELLNRSYRRLRDVYDLSRKYYLFGRDRVLEELLQQPWERFVEIGPGQGRNLRILHRRRPEARYAGIEGSPDLLARAKEDCPWASFAAGEPETADIAAAAGGRPDRILFSYSLSLARDPEAAIRNARASLAPGGEAWVVDFADLAGFWRPARARIESFLDTFSVHPLPEPLLARQAKELRYGPSRYYVVAKLPPSES